MATSSVSVSGVISARELLGSLLVPDPPPFALLRRASANGAEVELMTGEVAELSTLAALPLPEQRLTAGRATPAVLAVIPFRQVTERGYACYDDGEPILAITASKRATAAITEILELLSELGAAEVTMPDGGFDLDDDEYEQVVEQIIDGEIRTGEGSNFVIKRSFTAILSGYRLQVAMTIFRRLLVSESNAYWTFLVHTGDRTFVGASPEQHVQMAGGIVRMNPISGTYRYPPSGAELGGLLEFLADQKEINELYMVVDEELKMLAGVCDGGARVRGPYLREMARLAHTEYVLEGHSSRDVRDVLRATMFAPTIIGSPLENACRVIARHEPAGRGYYGGAVALLGRDAAGEPTMDSAILIRTAEVRRNGFLRIDAGATLVRDSKPSAEVAETWAKVAALLAAIGVDRRAPATGWTDPARPADGARTGPAGSPIATNPEVLTALRRRNAGLSSFWLASGRTPVTPGSAQRRVLIVDAEDMFTGMLGHQLRSIGQDAVIRPWAAVRLEEAEKFECVVLGPGPGDPRAVDDPKIARLREMIRFLLTRRIPLVTECLSHQVLCSMLGLRLRKRGWPNQGTRHRIDLFGTPELVGFYNSYAATHGADRLPATRGRGVVELCRDARTGEVHALRGDRFASVQFHVESVLTQHGTEILAGLLAWAARRPDRPVEPVELPRSGTAAQLGAGLTAFARPPSA